MSGVGTPATLVQVPLVPADGLKISALLVKSKGVEYSPPTTKTLPSGNVAAGKNKRATFMEGNCDQMPLT